MASQPGRTLLLLLALLGAGLTAWLLAPSPLPQMPPVGPEDPAGPPDPDPPLPPQGSAPSLVARVERLAIIPDPAAPPPLYAGAEVGLRGSLEVVDVHGRPWPGEVLLEVQAGPAAGRTLAAGAGARLVGLPEGLSLAEVRMPGWPAFRRFLRLRREGTCALIGPAAAPGPVRGRVYGPDGKPLGGAEVEVDGQRALSDPEGDFSLPEVVPGEALFAIRAAGCAPLFQSAMVGMAYAPRPPLFVLQRGVAVAGQVLFPDRPSAGVEVYLLPSGQGLGGPRFPFALQGSLRTGPDGSFAFPALPEGERFLVWAQGEDLVAEGPGVELGPLVAGVRQGLVLVKLRRLPRVAGSVTAAGRPLAGALVRTGPGPAWRPGQARLPGSALADLQGGLVAGAVLHAVRREVRTDAEGRFSIALAVPAGSAAVLDCLAPGFLPQRLEKVRPGQQVAIELEPEGEAGAGPPALLLARPADVPVAIRVVLRLDDRAALPEEAWVQDQDLEVALELPGIYRVTLRWRNGPAWQVHEETLVVRGGRRLPWPF